MQGLTPATDTAALCARLCAAYPRRAAALQRMHDVCAEMAQTPGVIYSLASVAQACGKKRHPDDEPGPAEGTIRNPEGEPYRLLIAAFAERNPVSKHPRRTDPTEAELGRASPLVRHHVRALERRATALGAENRVLREEVGQLRAKLGGNCGEPEAAVPPEGIEELRDWLSPTSHAKRGWRVDEGGRLLDARGTTVMRAEAYRALTKTTEIPY
ncbi:hypothetical protein DFR29_11527 [Tahibacter aquaticus]|uniref:Uncharacterized protein n=1 Tax=Tahibacter aquaticus TaxID=520092 RepID=A0A4R6YPU4_9GAMM|nr:gamma-mobile-trio protein GmtX [Tahibacter aquaticus]TDR39639.1 hypothetical protein DFR29_11527 [Tahibacter aquaticus]